MKPEVVKCDVLVAGGGSAGIAAAVAAARQGASVLLLEKNGFMGGKATAAYVGTVCGLYYRSESASVSYVSEGFAKEFAEKLIQQSGRTPITNKHGLSYLPYHPLDYKLLCDNYTNHEKISVFFHASLAGVERENNTIRSVQVISYDRLINIEAKAFVDCTGEALLSVMSNAPVIESDEYQTPAQVFSMEGILAISEANLSMILMKEIQQAIQEGQLPETYANVTVVPGSFYGNSAFLKIGIPVKIQNELNKITSVERTAREMLSTLSSFLIKNVEAFKEARVGHIAPEVGVRTGRRHKGKYILTREDVVGCVKHKESAGRGAWPIEFWDLGKRVKMDFFAFDDYYDIPVDCLRSAEIENLFFAGRNISATEEAIASARVIGTCLQTGYIAGELACKIS